MAQGRRTALICTVGTSLFDGNLARLSGDAPDAPERREAIRATYEKKRWADLAREMAQVDPTDRFCGAEINTIEEARKKNWLDLRHLTFLVSDTPKGKDSGVLLKKYFEIRKGRDLPDLQAVEYAVVEQLQDTDPKHFRTHGLRNLIRRAGEYIERFGGPECAAIDATGGYKAQIAVAVVLGQVLSIPVMYKHERFPAIIEFPPLPIAFDYTVLGANTALLAAFERGTAFSSDELGGAVDEKLRVLLTEVDGNGTALFELSPLGQIYLTGFRMRNPKPVALDAATDRKAPAFGNDHHYPDGFQAFVTKVWKETPWIRMAHSVPYAKQPAIRRTFDVREENGESMLIGGFTDAHDFGGRFRLRLSDESPNALTWAALHLNDKYGA